MLGESYSSRFEGVARVVSLAALLAIEAACAEPFDVPIVWEGEHLRVGTDKDIDAWCPGTMPRMDAYTGGLKQVMGVPDDLVIDFYVLENPLEDYVGGCAEDSPGCSDGAAYSRFMPHDHELVHAVRYAEGLSHRAIEEGAASYWGDLLAPEGVAEEAELIRMGDVLEAADADAMTLADYLRAAHFTSYLVHQYGTSANKTLLRETEWGMRTHQLDEVFERLVGSSIDEVIAEYEGSWPWCGEEAMRSSFFDCSAPAIGLCAGPVDTHPLVSLDFEVSWFDHAFEFDVSCADSQVIGPRLGRIWRHAVVEVPIGGTHTLGAVSDIDPADVKVTVKRCDTDCARATPIQVPVSDIGAVVIDVEFDPGRYLVRLEAKEETAGPIAIGWACPEI